MVVVTTRLVSLEGLATRDERSGGDENVEKTGKMI